MISSDKTNWLSQIAQRAIWHLLILTLGVLSARHAISGGIVYLFSAFIAVFVARVYLAPRVKDSMSFDLLKLLDRSLICTLILCCLVLSFIMLFRTKFDDYTAMTLWSLFLSLGPFFVEIRYRMHIGQKNL
jgi:hypothetical protein